MDGKQYRKRAGEVRAEAERMTDPDARKTLLEVAANYETLAKTLDANEARRRR